MSMRPVLQDEIALVINTLIAMREKNPGKQMMHSDPEIARAYIKQAVVENRCYMVDDTFFIMFDVGCLWFTDTPFLLEQLVLRVRSHNFHVGNAIDALAELAKFHGCTTIVAGDTQVGVMTPHYINAGYQPLGTQLIKEIS